MRKSENSELDSSSGSRTRKDSRPASTRATAVPAKSCDAYLHSMMQVGIDSFAAAHDDSSLAVNPSGRLRNLVEQIELADQVGLDVFGVGEHHRREFLGS